MQQTLTCAAEARAADESLAGTFKPADSFVLIESSLPEYGGWQSGIVKKASQTGELAAILQHVQQLPRVKVLLIRRPQRTGRSVYIAITNQQQPKIYHRQLTDYDELLGLDLATVAAESTPRIHQQAMDEIDELYAICTNGRHDPCCAAYGLPVYQALIEHAGTDKVWQTTHIGGHRLAATLIAFPHGISYGQLDPFNAEEVVTNHRAGQLLPHKFRGRGAYAGHQLDEAAHLAAGAAEAQLRATARKYALDDLRLEQVRPLDEMQWQVRFIDQNGQAHQATVKAGWSPPRQTSCGDAPKPMPLHQVAVDAT